MEHFNRATRDLNFRAQRPDRTTKMVPMCTLARSHRERIMNNLQVREGSKSFSLNILPVSSLKPKI